MRARSRGGEIPGLVACCWAASVLLGGVVVALGAAHRTTAVGLTPATLPDYLAHAVGPAARDVRVNGVYGSGRDGAWQFVAHLTWRTAAGEVTGGVLTLPQQVGGQASDSPASPGRLVEEEARGWTLARLRRDTEALAPVNATVALLDLEIPTTDGGSLTFCAAHGDGPAACSSRDLSDKVTPFTAAMHVVDGDGALSVRRS